MHIIALFLSSERIDQVANWHPMIHEDEKSVYRYTFNEDIFNQTHLSVHINISFSSSLVSSHGKTSDCKTDKEGYTRLDLVRRRQGIKIFKVD
jgi:hypothetical protein